MFYYFYDDDESVVNNLNSTKLEYIKIKKLFGYANVELHFDKEVNIYIGENGLGKTTILNCVYYVLKKKYDKLAEIDFSSIHIKFTEERREFVLSVFDINDYNKRKMPRRRWYDEDLIKLILNEATMGLYTINGIDSEELEFATLKLSRVDGIPMDIARRQIMEYLKIGRFNSDGEIKKGNYKKVIELNEALDEYITQKILYFTTYRRIENDFSKLINKGERVQESDMLIRFGMADVEKSIGNILNLIRENSRESFNKMTGVLLKQYASRNKINSNVLSDISINKDMLKITLDRLGNEIAEDDRNKIISLLDNGDIYKREYSYLLDLIIKLIDNYNKQKVYDDKIQNFVYTCNKYLNGKQFVYNQSDLKLDIKLLNNKLNNIKLMQLSSGEKQIVSLFSKLYLENDKDSILVIDEPELSLSMKWQKMLLPDIMRSGNCKLLLTVTHSPFIFENEFDMDAQEMRNCITN
ncbi:MAG: AAA family ATPase [Candidatus Ornithomonoglobus sp.]